MKKILLALTGSLLSITGIAQVKTCITHCAPTHVLLFDFSVTVSDSNMHPELYKKLYYIAPQVRKLLQSKASCLTYLDADEIQRPEDIFPNGSTTPSVYVAGAGEYAIGEYLLTGSVRGEGNVFSVTVHVETSISRKTIKTIRIPLSFAGGDTYSNTATKIVEALGPLQDLIMDYENRERNNNNKVAFGEPAIHAGETDDLLLVKPRKTKLAMGEETEVEIILKDCDGYPLKNRRVSFEGERYDSVWQKGTYGGTVTPSNIITDANGKAKVKFKAAPQYRFAAIVAHYTFEQPCGRKDIISGSAPISLQLKPFKVIVRYSKRIEVNTHSGNTTSEYTERSEGLQHFLAQYKAEFYYAPLQFPEGLALASNDDTVTCSMYMASEKGKLSDIGFLHYQRIAKDGTTIANYQNSHNLMGIMVENEKAVASIDTSGFHPFAFALNLQVTGTSNGATVEPDILTVANFAASSLNKPGEVIYYSHPMNFPDLPYQRDCTFIYQFNTSKNDRGVLTKSEEFLKIKVLIEK